MASTPIDIKAITIDSFVAEYNINRVDFIKIDVEGFEEYVIKGGINTLKKFKPKLFVEISEKHLQDNNSSAKQVFALLNSLGYQIRIPTSPHIIDENFVLPNHHFDVLCS